MKWQTTKIIKGLAQSKIFKKSGEGREREKFDSFFLTSRINYQC